MLGTFNIALFFTAFAWPQAAADPREMWCCQHLLVEHSLDLPKSGALNPPCRAQVSDEAVDAFERLYMEGNSLYTSVSIACNDTEILRESYSGSGGSWEEEVEAYYQFYH